MTVSMLAEVANGREVTIGAGGWPLRPSFYNANRTCDN
jgi:hypothetical protein